MLPAQHKLNSSMQFRMVMRKGRRAGTKTVVVHLWDSAGSMDGTENQGNVASFGGPRFGLVVSKAVGNAVIRHRTSRRLRHICANIIAQQPELLSPTHHVVIRALAGAGEASSAELARDIAYGLDKARRVRTPK
ncbi:Ribonuclease P protein component [Corynebacterium deserti GIMN1.010]|uniref:Ribonuclease P protein component n=1 Tax=Corynebacterium deserti GIMN1.010 TaxID=931089 RepID=A0A0M5IM66_9CORY|nr:ribonuclease P protein component [Corynebacterium deserti]ALC07156.1 Ribonuclease P protein component [Corynebacterium deserti GIMN1.010]